MIHPNFDRVVVKRDAKPEEVKEGLIYRPGTTIARPTTGTVLAVGDGCTELKVGDRIQFEHFAGYTVEVDGEELDILRETEIVGVLQED